MHNRLLCGDGVFDLSGLMDLLRSYGFQGPWGVEILSASFKLRVREALKLAPDSANTVL